ncbi:hypothetical protein CPB83DRAFT_898813 [Crepidotus variabilis]|uniref:F-box domain-containing protein n=1 Tax=Crepidotus variabilis TaxID=179855 RepID=A0A9P6E6B5_9AGAR|nr:hypothetical protein CPB83DRAFT_898813 [Crepidotus variabilis]
MDILPLELFDHVFSFLPLCDGSRYPSEDLLSCTKVSRTLSILSRRRICSTLVIGASPSEEKTRATLEALVKLLRAHPDLLRSTHAVEIYLVTSIEWPSLCDAPLHDILEMIQSRPQKLKSLKISGRACSSLETMFQRRTREAIMSLVPFVQSLSLERLIISSPFLEKLCAIHHVALSWVQMDIQATDLSRVRTPTFVPHSHVSVDMFTLKSIHPFYQHYERSPPSYSNLTIDTFPPLGPSCLRDLITNSKRTLRTLTLKASMQGIGKDFTRLDFSLFKKLTTLRIYHNHHSLTEFGIIYPLWTCLNSLGRLLSSDTRRLPSCLLDVEIDVVLVTPIAYAAIGTNPFGFSSIPQLSPENLTALHPRLESFLIRITPPKLADHCQFTEGEEIGALLRKEVKRSIDIILPNSVDVSNDIGIVYRALLHLRENS